MSAQPRTRRLNWRFFDGTISISMSMWFAIGLNQCSMCAGWPLLGFLSRLATNETGIIIVATALLFPTAALMFGGVFMFFAAKEAAENWSRARNEKAMARGREEGRKEGIKQGIERGLERGRKDERERIAVLLEESGVTLPPEVLRRLDGEDE